VPFGRHRDKAAINAKDTFKDANYHNKLPKIASANAASPRLLFWFSPADDFSLLEVPNCTAVATHCQQQSLAGQSLVARSFESTKTQATKASVGGEILAHRLVTRNRPSHAPSFVSDFLAPTHPREAGRVRSATEVARHGTLVRRRESHLSV